MPRFSIKKERKNRTEKGIQKDLQRKRTSVRQVERQKGRDRGRDEGNVEQSPDITPPNAGHFYKLSIKSDHTRRDVASQLARCNDGGHPKLLMCVDFTVREREIQGRGSGTKEEKEKRERETLLVSVLEAKRMCVLKREVVCVCLRERQRLLSVWARARVCHFLGVNVFGVGVYIVCVSPLNV